MALPGVVALDAVGFFLADIQLPVRDRQLIRCPVVRAIKTRVPRLLYPGQQPLEGGAVTTAELPVNQLP